MIEIKKIILVTLAQASIVLSHKQSRLLKCRRLFNKIWFDRAPKTNLNCSGKSK
jgi:predicted ATPase